LNYGWPSQAASGGASQRALPDHRPRERAVPAGAVPQERVGKLADAGTRAIIAFTEAEGTDSHCEPAPAGLRGGRIFDWLNQQIPAG
jgi:hypothetical protein